MVAYADTSFLFSLYAQDGNTLQAAQISRMLATPLVITPLQRHELRNAFRLSVFRGDMTAAQCRNLLAMVESDMKTGALVETPVAWAEVYAGAEMLSTAHTEKLGVRAFDILHVAAAAALGASNFYTFDVRQKALAIRTGMKVKP